MDPLRSIIQSNKTSSSSSRSDYMEVPDHLLSYDDDNDLDMTTDDEELQTVATTSSRSTVLQTNVSPERRKKIEEQERKSQQYEQRYYGTSSSSVGTSIKKGKQSLHLEIRGQGDSTNSLLYSSTSSSSNATSPGTILTSNHAKQKQKQHQHQHHQQQQHSLPTPKIRNNNSLTSSTSSNNTTKNGKHKKSKNRSRKNSNGSSSSNKSHKNNNNPNNNNSSSSSNQNKGLVSHLSYIFNESETTDDEDDDDYLLENSLFSPTQQHERYGTKRWLFLLTAGFVLITVLIRSRENSSIIYSGEDDDEENEIVVSDNNANKDGSTITTTVKNDNGVACENIVLGTLVDPIMALKNTSSVEHMANGAVAADDVRCSEMGVSIMEEYNGNAVDAAVTTTLCLGLVNPASSGIGGGAFILIHSDATTNETLAQQEGRHFGNPSFNSTSVVNAEDLRSESFKTESSSEDTKKKKIVEMIDCRETAPGKSTVEMFSNLPPQAAINGPLSIAIPGELRGLELAHSRYGSLPWKTVLEPVVQLAERGVVVSKHLAYDIKENKEYIETIGIGLKKVLTRNNEGKTYLKEGDLMRRPQYAKTLRGIMDHGSDYIYTGEIAEQMAEEIQKEGGIVTKEDFEGYKPALRDPLIASVSGFTIASVAPPSSGGAAIIGTLRFLAGYMTPYSTFADTLSKHRLVEAYKHVFAIRMSLSDPAYSPNVTKAAVADLTSGSYMEDLRRNTLDDGVLKLSKYGGEKWALIKDSDDNGKPQDMHEGDRVRRRRLRANDQTSTEDDQYHRKTMLFNYLNDKGTTHLSVVDKDRNAVSITSSVNSYFGSMIVSESTGILYNGVMDDFATPGRPNFFGLQPAESNYIRPGKRPLSSMSPTIVFRSSSETSSANEELKNNDFGKLFMVLGSSGGPKIITAVLQVFLNHAILGMSIYKSIVHPRVHNQLLYHGSSVTLYDLDPLLDGTVLKTSQRTRNALEKRGQILRGADYLGTTQAIAVDLETDTLSATSDVRKNGKSAGY